MAIRAPEDAFVISVAHVVISVVIPACNEERSLPASLAAIEAARQFAPEQRIEIVVVDNDSTDCTAATAARAGATVVREPMRNVGRARNRGAASAHGDCLVFVDADTIVPIELFREIGRLLENRECIGGAVDARYSPRRALIRWHLRLWRLIGRAVEMAQGATQFCRRSAFDEIGGYDETLWMGEDVDFYWRLKAFARRSGTRVEFLRDIHVIPSSRRFDRWPVWKTMFFTNPLYALMFRRRRAAWRGWYDELVR